MTVENKYENSLREYYKTRYDNFKITNEVLSLDTLIGIKLYGTYMEYILGVAYFTDAFPDYADVADYSGTVAAYKRLSEETFESFNDIKQEVYTVGYHIALRKKNKALEILNNY